MKIIKNKQALAMAITGFSNGFNTGIRLPKYIYYNLQRR